MSEKVTTTDKKKSALKIKLLLVLLAITALLLRVQYVTETVIDQPIRADAAQYVLYGYNLSHFGVYSKSLPSESPQPDSFRSPGYPLLIAISFLIGDEKSFYPIMLLTQAISGAALVPLTYALGSLFLPVWASLGAATLVAFSPHLISMTSYLLTETLFGVVFLVALVFFCFALKNLRFVFFALAGFFFGLAYLTNETSLFVPFILAWAVFYYYRSTTQVLLKRNLYKGVGLLLLVFIIFPLGWQLRNLISIPAGAPKGSSRAISTMSHGTYPGFIYKDSRYKYFPYREDPMQPAYGESMDNFVKIFSGRFKERPIRYLSWYLLEKPYYLWSWNILQGQGDVYIYPVISSLYTKSTFADWTRVVMKLLHPFILILALFGTILCLRRYRKTSQRMNLDSTPFFLFTLCLYYTLLYTVFAPWPRYSIPFRPELYLLALWTFEQGRKAFVSNEVIFGIKGNLSR
jgi:4-amino-4-deoxy-L-arabinose transferase-like glycosyltransferase